MNVDKGHKTQDQHSNKTKMTLVSNKNTDFKVETAVDARLASEQLVTSNVATGGRYSLQLSTATTIVKTTRSHCVFVT
jgi:hypothetical protein